MSCIVVCQHVHGKNKNAGPWNSASLPNALKLRPEPLLLGMVDLAPPVGVMDQK